MVKWKILVLLIYICIFLSWFLDDNHFPSIKPKSKASNHLTAYEWSNNKQSNLNKIKEMFRPAIKNCSHSNMNLKRLHNLASAHISWPSIEAIGTARASPQIKLISLKKKKLRRRHSHDDNSPSQSRITF